MRLLTSKGWRLLACLLLPALLLADSNCLPQAPCYSEDSIVNAASFLKGSLSPNGFAAIYGTDLSYATRPLINEDVQGGLLPVRLAGVTVRVGPLQAPVFYVSPGQVNVLIPAALNPGTHDVQVLRDGRAGPPVRVTIADVSPALFLLDAETVVASHLDYSVVTKQQPARPGELVILWATGLGRYVPGPAMYAEMPTQAAWIERVSEFRVLFDGYAGGPDRVAYVGITPGCAGLYQINLRLPESLGSDPELRIAIGDAVSQPGVRLPVRPED